MIICVPLAQAYWLFLLVFDFFSQ